ncbi:MAG: hypothetical protein IBJ11_03575 [Phycisphaerales bacterium]|nr:hypothetical protein [Phycisphaerales bacterium]
MAHAHHQASTAAEPKPRRRTADPGILGNIRTLILRQLDTTERLLIILWYVEKMSRAEIAKTLNMTAAQVEKFHAAVLGKLRAGAATAAA